MIKIILFYYILFYLIDDDGDDDDDDDDVYYYYYYYYYYYLFLLFSYMKAMLAFTFCEKLRVSFHFETYFFSDVIFSLFFIKDISKLTGDGSCKVLTEVLTIILKM